MYEDLIAPFNFAIQKTPEELTREREEVLTDYIPFFRKDPTVYDSQFQLMNARFELLWSELENEKQTAESLKERTKGIALNIFDSIYQRGVIFLEGEMSDADEETDILLLDGLLQGRKKWVISLI